MSDCSTNFQLDIQFWSSVSETDNILQVVDGRSSVLGCLCCSNLLHLSATNALGFLQAFEESVEWALLS